MHNNIRKRFRKPLPLVHSSSGRSSVVEFSFYTVHLLYYGRCIQSFTCFIEKKQKTVQLWYVSIPVNRWTTDRQTDRRDSDNRSVWMMFSSSWNLQKLIQSPSSQWLFIVIQWCSQSARLHLLPPRRYDCYTSWMEKQNFLCVSAATASICHPERSKRGQTPEVQNTSSRMNNTWER